MSARNKQITKILHWLGYWHLLQCLLECALDRVVDKQTGVVFSLGSLDAAPSVYAHS